MPVDWSPLWLSLRVASLATVLSLVLGLGLAWLLASRNFGGKEVIQAVATFPYALPPLIAGTYCVLTLAHSRFAFTWHIGVIAGAVGIFPLMVRGARRAFQTRNLDYENAARSLGASEWRVFWRIALPLAYEPIVAAAAIGFARVLTEFAAVVLVAFQLAGGIAPFPFGLVAVIVGMALASVYLSNRLEHEGKSRV
ncbi:MAG TPA: ABC transporter permease subunit [Bryobacteraceae bacterium]|nr:ABC transporter permease subunit [Bryobacteraceae bacterium]